MEVGIRRTFRWGDSADIAFFGFFVLVFGRQLSTEGEPHVAFAASRDSVRGAFTEQREFGEHAARGEPADVMSGSAVGEPQIAFTAACDFSRKAVRM